MKPVQLRQLQLILDGPRLDPWEPPEISTLTNFLLAFQGLESLYIMSSQIFDHGKFDLHVCGISHHAKTLKSLIWHHRNWGQKSGISDRAAAARHLGQTDLTRFGVNCSPVDLVSAHFVINAIAL